MSAFSLYILLYSAVLKKSSIEKFLALFNFQWMDLGLGLFQNMFHILLIYTNNFCFGYITVSCFFETYRGVWLAGEQCLNSAKKWPLPILLMYILHFMYYCNILMDKTLEKRVCINNIGNLSFHMMSVALSICLSVCPMSICLTVWLWFSAYLSVRTRYRKIALKEN